MNYTIGNAHNCARNHAICDGSAIVARVVGNGYPTGTGWSAETEATARLFAAAPDLLAALVELQKELRQNIKLDVRKHYSLMVADAAANKAIAKATGNG